MRHVSVDAYNVKYVKNCNYRTFPTLLYMYIVHVYVYVLFVIYFKLYISLFRVYNKNVHGVDYF